MSLPTTSQAIANMDKDTVYDPTLRNKELEKIYKLSKFLYEHPMDETLLKTTEIDLDISNRLSEVLHTMYTYMRKKSNKNLQNVRVLNGDETAKIKTVVASISAMEKTFMLANTGFAFDYNIATPLVNALTSFKCMWDEVRLSSSKFTMKINGVNRNCNIKKFGLDNSAIPRLTGIIWKPERRSGMLRTMGPLTLCIMLAAETRYTENLEKALLNSISMLPLAPEIVKCLKEMKDPSDLPHGLLSLLNDIFMIIGSPGTKQIHFPLLFFAKAFEISRDETLKLTFSGLAGFMFYHNMLPTFTWKKRSNDIPENIAQVVFHAMFGAAADDLGLLSQITNRPIWQQRKNLLNVFKNTSTAPKKEFSPIKYTYVPKLASANLIKNAGTITPQKDAEATFSGAQKRSYDDAFTGFVEKGHKGTENSVEKGWLTYSLKNFKDALVYPWLHPMQELRLDRLTELGTTKWYKVGEALEEVDVVFNRPNQSFYA